MNPEIKAPIRVFLVDDHDVVRAGLRTLLAQASEIEIVGEANTVGSALPRLRESRPDIVLLDVRLPDGSGLAVCRYIRQLNLNCRSLILTSYADEKLISEAIAVGADGYLLKEIDAAGLLRAITDVVNGKSIWDPAVTRQIIGKIRASADTEVKHKLSVLSPQEKRVLALVAEGTTNKEIGVEMGLSDKTVKNYLSNVLDKLQLSRRSHAAAFFTQHSQPREA
jgi:two-component system response regulator DevR